MIHTVDPGPPELAQTRFILPADAKVLPVAGLSARQQARIGASASGLSVVTRQGFRVATRLIPAPLAALLGEFRAPSRLTDGVLRFARSQGQEPQAVLEAAFDALASLVEARLLVPEHAPQAEAAGPSLAPGEVFAGFEIAHGVRSLDDSEVFRARAPDGSAVALKIAREGQPRIREMLAHEASVLQHLAGEDSPAFLATGEERGRAFIAMAWCSGVPIGSAAQALRAAGDRPRLHALVSRLLAAYGRLHARGVLHGDIHPGNCLLGDDGRVVVLDFGHARWLAVGPAGDGAARGAGGAGGSGGAGVDPARAGIAQFHDPQLAQALLAGTWPPPACPASEQFALATLAYLLLTGLHPVDAPAVQDELLRRIATRPPLPFPARGVAAWPGVEAVLRRALAHAPEARYPTVAALAQAFAGSNVVAAPAAPGPRRPMQRPTAAFSLADGRPAAVLEALRRLDVPPGLPVRDHAWLALRAAMAEDDAELLGAADLLAAAAGGGLEGSLLRALVARARSDRRAEGRALGAFLEAARAHAARPGTGPSGGPSGGHGMEPWQVLGQAGVLLQGASSQLAEAGALADWASRRLRQLPQPPRSGEPAATRAACAALYAALALVRTGRVAAPAGLPSRLARLRHTGAGSIWLWGLAHEVQATDDFREAGLQARLPREPAHRCLALLRRYQISGDTRWRDEARQAVARPSRAAWPDSVQAWLLAECRMPETALRPPFASLFGLRWT